MRMRTLVLTAALLLAACGSQSEKEVASGTVTDPETGETTDYKVTASGEGDEGNVSIKTEDGEMSFGGGAANARSGERRVGQERVSRCISRWLQYIQKKKRNCDRED